MFHLRFAEDAQPMRPRIERTPVRVAAEVTGEFVLTVAFFASILCGVLVCAGVLS